MNFEAKVITLDPQSERFQRFQTDNSCLPYQVFNGIRGADLTREQRLAQGLVTPECLDQGAVTDGEIGCAASHLALWREAARRNVPMLVLEDDAITHPLLSEVIAKIDFNFDLIFFALNTDTLHCAVSPEGILETSTFMIRYPPPELIKKILAQTDSSRLVYRRLLSGFGTCCYMISPQGAATLAKTILPLRLESIAIAGWPNAHVTGTSIDRRLNGLFGTLQCFVARPFLAWTPNMDSTTLAR